MAAASGCVQQDVVAGCGNLWVSCGPWAGGRRLRSLASAVGSADWRARVCDLCSHRDRAWIVAWFFAFPRIYSGGVSRGVGLGFHVLLYRGSGGALLSRLDAEPSGAAARAERGAVDDCCSVWGLALQQ